MKYVYIFLSFLNNEMMQLVDTLGLRQNGHLLADDMCILANENFQILNNVSLRYVMLWTASPAGKVLWVFIPGKLLAGLKKKT